MTALARASSNFPYPIDRLLVFIIPVINRFMSAFNEETNLGMLSSSYIRVLGTGLLGQ
jgi:hypothetical protein